MGKQTGNIRITGTFGNICFYRVGSEYYVRMKSSLTRERFRKDKAFTRSRKSAKKFALANQLASKVYGLVEKEKRVYSLYCLLRKQALQLVHEDRDRNQVIYSLIEWMDANGINQQIADS